MLRRVYRRCQEVARSDEACLGRTKRNFERLVCARRMVWAGNPENFMIRLATTVVCLAGFIQGNANSQSGAPPIPLNRAQEYFGEAQRLCSRDHGQLWGVSLCGPILFVDPDSRYVVASAADAKGILKPEAGVFVGFLPKDQNASNTATEWSGRCRRIASSAKP